jgi:TolB-like protein
MKKILIILLVCLFPTALVFSQTAMTLNEAISDAGRTFGLTIPSRSRILVLHFQVPAASLGDYLIKNMTGALAQNPSFSVIDERNRPSLKEYNLKIEEELSDAQAQSIGARVLVDTVITGSVIPSGDSYALKIRAVSTPNGRIYLNRTYNLKQDQVLAGLLKPAGVPAAALAVVPSPTAQPVPAIAPALAAAPIPATRNPVPAFTGVPPNGTYILNKRSEGGKATLLSVTINGGEMTVTLAASDGGSMSLAPPGNPNRAYYVKEFESGKIYELKDRSSPEKWLRFDAVNSARFDLIEGQDANYADTMGWNFKNVDLRAAAEYKGP